MIRPWVRGAFLLGRVAAVIDLYRAIVRECDGREARQDEGAWMERSDVERSAEDLVSRPGLPGVGFRIGRDRCRRQEVRGSAGGARKDDRVVGWIVVAKIGDGAGLNVGKEDQSRRN